VPGEEWPEEWQYGRLANSANQNGMGWLAELQYLGSLGVSGLVGLAEPPCFDVAGWRMYPLRIKELRGVVF